MMMETAIYTREFLYVRELRDTGRLGRIRRAGDHGRDPPADQPVQHQKRGADQREREQRHQQGLRAAHDVILGAEPDRVDVDTEVRVLRRRRDVPEVEQQRAEHGDRRGDRRPQADPLLELGATGPFCCHAGPAYGEPERSVGEPVLSGGDPVSPGGDEPVSGGPDGMMVSVKPISLTPE